MNDLQMILYDGTALSLDAFGLPMHAVMTCASEDDMMAAWKQLTPANLSRVTVKQGDETAFAYTGGKLTGTQSVVNGDGTLTVHFYMDGVREVSADETTQEYVMAAKILLGEEE